ncbi:uncharacterized protein K444DRAFT_613662 [Hyaloscypha bicolor E]|uniref:Uncharacterized protein n=1 Tax=Hyaloscypha bicolor E TaxID=1095630 RepID=A0A2J6T755_9HELO|nr:uncharacterized protein K444DRAFT_613662 [Hyaloscypha bicolor E]PMD58861.1 hypothetical protein K444DRAFT_613662 [Hyaloscypha bicolor E]
MPATSALAPCKPKIGLTLTPPNFCTSTSQENPRQSKSNKHRKPRRDRPPPPICAKTHPMRMPTNANTQLPLSVREPRPAAPVGTVLSDIFFQAWPLSPATAIPTSNRVGRPPHMADQDAPPTHAADCGLMVQWKPRSTRPPHIVPRPPTAENPQLAAVDSPRMSVPNHLTRVAMEGMQAPRKDAFVGI